jgi:hypothetical protein
MYKSYDITKHAARRQTVCDSNSSICEIVYVKIAVVKIASGVDYNLTIMAKDFAVGILG